MDANPQPERVTVIYCDLYGNRIVFSDRRGLHFDAPAHFHGNTADVGRDPLANADAGADRDAAAEPDAEPGCTGMPGRLSLG